VSTYPQKRPKPPLTDLPLFSDKPRSRGSDPETSRLAEKHMVESGSLGEQRKRVLAYVRMYPGDTAREYDLSNLTSGAFHRRLVELERMGLVRRGGPRKCSVGGRMAHTWYPKE